MVSINIKLPKDISPKDQAIFQLEINKLINRMLYCSGYKNPESVLRDIKVSK